MEIGLSLGSNLGDRLEHLRRAAQRISVLPGVRIVVAAPVYETEPVGVSPVHAALKYLNTVLILDGPAELDARLRVLHRRFEGGAGDPDGHGGDVHPPPRPAQPARRDRLNLQPT